jgi:hypothetical protein
MLLLVFVSLLAINLKMMLNPSPNDRAIVSRFSNTSRAYHARHFATLQPKRTARAVPTEPHARTCPNTASLHPTFSFL